MGGYEGNQIVRSDDTLNLKRVFITVVAVYLLLVICFYFLAGDQLRFRESRGDMELPVADAGTIELSQGAVVEQVFQVKIQRLESIAVQFGSYYRENHGTITMELLIDGEMLMQQSFDAATVQEGTILTMTSGEPLESVYGRPLMIRLYADSYPGDAVTPLMSTATEEEGFSLSLNGGPASGVLCFNAAGTDYIWTGLHYWQFAAAGLALVLLFIGIIWLRLRHGKRSYVANAIFAMRKYRFLIRQLVARDFKTKYKRSILGVFWSFLNPLLMMLVQYFVFSTIFKNDISNFAVYLLIGVTMFNFFSEACGMSLTSIVGNASLITKVYMPKYIYPLTRVMSSLINFAISLIPLLIVCFATGVHFERATLLSLYFFACQVVFSLGMGLLLSTSMVFFRDTQFLWNVLSMMWMYATPLFYPESIIPDNFKIILKINPLYYFVQNARMCILDGLSPEPRAYMLCMLMALAALVAGAVVFRKNQDKFVLYL